MTVRRGDTGSGRPPSLPLSNAQGDVPFRPIRSRPGSEQQVTDPYLKDRNVRRFTLLLTLMAVLGLLAVPAAQARTPGSAERLSADLAAVPHTATSLNADADGTLKLRRVAGDRVVVVLRASGLSPDLPHAVHIHGGLSGPNVCPPAGADGEDGLVSTLDGIPFYGGINVSLTTSGDTSPASALALDRFPVADADGDLRYQRTFVVPDAVAEALDDLHVVVHGLDLSGNGAYDGDAPLLQGAEATLPVLCGQID